jgi:amino acid permease
MKVNNPVLGLIIGLLFPVLGMVVMYFIWFHGSPVNEVVRDLLSNHDLASKVLSLSLLINILPFSYYTSKRLDHTARGILIATVLYFVFIVLLKFVWS